MKVIVIIFSIFVLQTSASFFDEFRGAVSSVENSFGKLLSDVIYDVKETIDCTLLAVEQVLALGVFGDSTEYDKKCRDGTELANPAEIVDSEPAPTLVQDTLQDKSVPILSIKENRAIDSSILDVDEVLCDVLKKDDTHSQLEGVKLALKNETERLNEISDLLRRQLDDLSNEVKEKFKSIELQTSEPSVETIWNDIKLLHEIEHKHKNTAEAKKISHILDQILSILDADEQDRTAADDYKIKEIMRKLSKNSKDGASELWKDASDYPKDFREYAKRLFDDSKSSSSAEDRSSTPKPSAEKKGEEEKKEVTTTEKSKQPETTPTPSTTTTTTTEKPLTIEELAAEYGSLFDVMPDIENISHPHQESAKNIIEDTKVNEMVMKSLADLSSSKAARNLFDDPSLFDEN